MKYFKLLKYPLLLLAIILFPALTLAQEIEMADVMRSNGKIYVVVAVVAVVLIGLLVYVALLDRKVSRIENELNNKQK
jgi:CcmD family protein